jgi:hypothetical protein
VGPERIEDLYRLNEADVRAKGRDATEDLASLAGLKAHVLKVVAEGAAFHVRDLRVNGRDLMTELGMKPGPQLGKVLEALLELVLAEPSLNEREALLKAAREIVAAGGA